MVRVTVKYVFRPESAHKVKLANTGFHLSTCKSLSKGRDDK